MSVRDITLHIEDAAKARTQCAQDREAALANLDPNNTCRWIVGEQLAAMVWESAYDTALILARRANAHEERAHAAALERLMAVRDVEHETARAWRERYEGQLWITQDLDRRCAAKLRDSEREIARLRAAVGDAYGDLGAALVQALPSDDAIILGHVRAAVDTLRAAWRGSVGMPVREALAQEQALSALVGQVQYVPDAECGQMIDHEVEFGWLRVGQRVHVVAEDGRCGVVVRLPSYGLGVNWGEGVTVDALPDGVRIRAIVPDPDAETQQAEVQAVRDQLRAVTAERDQAQEDAVVVLNAYGHRGFVPGEVMTRVDGYRAAWVQRKAPPPKQVP